MASHAVDDLDQIILPDRVERMSAPVKRMVHKYAYIDGRGRHILCWDLARYVNHSCEANCLGSGYEFEMAIRDIYPGEQLTDDYGGLNIEEAFVCKCGSPQCRGVIHPDDILQLVERWDPLLWETFQLLPKVPQPLWPILRQQQEVSDVLEGRAKLASAIAHYHDQNASARL